MKKKIYNILSAALAVTALVSCNKEPFEENVIPSGERFEVCIKGQIGEFIPADATKATVQSVVRVSWSSDDKVYVYDGSANLGVLDVAPYADNNSFALLSGTITASAASPAPTKLTLVYVKGADTAPAISSGKISIDLSTQDKEEVPFVLYSTIDYSTDKLTKYEECLSFSFATSVMTVNCTGLAIGDGGSKIDITKAKIGKVNTVCELTVNTSGVSGVTGTKQDTIIRSAGFSQSDSRSVFTLAVAAESAAPTARTILVYQGDTKVSGSPFTTTQLAANNSYNMVFQLGEYVSGGSGYSPAVPATGVTLVKAATSIVIGANETLSATVTPANATHNQITWKSSDETVATVDENGKVTAVAEGTALITVTSADGHFTDACMVTVTPLDGALKGKFSVSNTKKVYFSKGNLYWDGDSFEFETNQYDFQSSWDGSHVSHFFWSKTAGKAYASEYNNEDLTSSDVFFTNVTSVTANPDIEINGVKGVWRSLSNEEWKYLLDSRTVNGGKGEGKSFSPNINYGGKMGFVLYPDNYNGEVLSGTVDTLPEGVVFLPATGYRDGKTISSPNVNGNIWTSSLHAGDLYGYCVSFSSKKVLADKTISRDSGYCVRLVTDI